MIFYKPCRFVVAAYALLTANADINTVRVVQQRELVATITAAVDLETAGNYAILTKTGISTVPTSKITGNIAVSPIGAAAMTGFNLNLNVNGTASTSTQLVDNAGKAYASNYIAPTPSILTNAVSDMETAYTDAAGRTNSNAAKINFGSGKIGSLTLTSNDINGDLGVYTFGTVVNIDTDVTFKGSLPDGSAAGVTADDVFVIQISGDLIMAANMKVILTNGAQAKNIFWQVAGYVKIGAGAHMEGIILGKTSVVFETGSSLNGRILAQTACDLQMATVTQPTIAN